MKKIDTINLCTININLSANGFLTIHFTCTVDIKSLHSPVKITDFCDVRKTFRIFFLIKQSNFSDFREEKKNKKPPIPSPQKCAHPFVTGSVVVLRINQSHLLNIN